MFFSSRQKEEVRTYTHFITKRSEVIEVEGKGSPLASLKKRTSGTPFFYVMKWSCLTDVSVSLRPLLPQLSNGNKVGR